MSEKNPNTDIRCRVSSCTYHCGDRDYCSLHSIQGRTLPELRFRSGVR